MRYLLHDFIIDENNCGHIKWKGQEFTTNPSIWEKGRVHVLLWAYHVQLYKDKNWQQTPSYSS